jgi:hypothetical protein
MVDIIMVGLAAITRESLSIISMGSSNMGSTAKAGSMACLESISSRNGSDVIEFLDHPKSVASIYYCYYSFICCHHFASMDFRAVWC